MFGFVCKILKVFVLFLSFVSLPDVVGESEGELLLYLDFLLFVYPCVVVNHLQGEPCAEETVDNEFPGGLPIEIYMLEVIGIEQVEVRFDLYLIGYSPFELRLDFIAGKPFVALCRVESHFRMDDL